MFLLCVYGLPLDTSRGGLLEIFEYPSVRGKLHVELVILVWIPTAASLLVARPSWLVLIGLKSI